MGTEATGLQCTIDWEASVSESGHVTFNRIDLDFPGTGWCGTLNDCNDAADWEGQIAEVEDPAIIDPEQFVIDLEFCLTGTALGGTPVGGHVTCHISDTQGECEHVHVAEQFPPPGTGGVVPQFVIEGSILITEEPDAPAFHIEHATD